METEIKKNKHFCRLIILFFLIIIISKNCIATTPTSTPPISFSKDEQSKILTCDYVANGINGTEIIVKGCFNYSSEFIKEGDKITNCTGGIIIIHVDTNSLIGSWDFLGDENNCSKNQSISIIAEEKKSESTPGFELIIIVCAIAVVLFCKRY